MKLYDYGFDDCEFTGIESFDGRMHHMQINCVTKSFNKAKSERIKQIKEKIDNLHKLLNEVESMTESDVYDRGCF